VPYTTIAWYEVWIRAILVHVSITILFHVLSFSPVIFHLLPSNLHGLSVSPDAPDATPRRRTRRRAASASSSRWGFPAATCCGRGRDSVPSFGSSPTA
jgi:hypothetical protein